MLPWLPVQDVSVWVAQREVLDLDQYVEVWGEDAAVPEADRVAWRARLGELGCTHVGFGWIVLERSRSPWRMLEDVSDAPRIPLGAEVAEQLRAFADEPNAVELLHEHLLFRDAHWRGNIGLDPFSAALLERIRAERAARPTKTRKAKSATSRSTAC